MWLKYTDREVDCFHPVCETILNKALEKLELNSTYQVEHHRTVGSLEMDFVISNIRTSKILCVIEVKRTIEAVLSTRYQLQAMGYVQELRQAEKEKEYYILTNLEAIALFKYSATRHNVIDQLLNPGIHTIARFSEHNKEEYISLLSEHFAIIIQRILSDDNNYFQSFRHFVSEISTTNDKVIADEKLWHTKFAALSYEYIRGSLNSAGRNQLIDIRRLHQNIKRICQEALRINFKGIFGLKESDYKELPSISSNTLGELYDLGSAYIDADAISDILFNLIAKDSPFPGAVPTDMELAKALGVVASCYCTKLEPTDKIIDPAAGSGNLISVIPTFYPRISPKQIIANDINEYLLQILSLRIGLKFPQTISTQDSPQISCKDICNLPKSAFDDVKLVVMNPPYLSHTSNASNDYKSGIIRRIRQIKGDSATTNSGKTPLESVFVELVAHMAKPHTTIACIVPLCHLYGQGESDILFREMLMQRFGLCCIFKYPQQNIFRTVVQNTCIIVGKVGVQPSNVLYITCNDSVDNIDYDSLKRAITDDNFTTHNGIEKAVFSWENLNNTINTGWHILDSIAADASGFLSNILSSENRFTHLINSDILENSFRGRVGNNGGSDLIFPRPPFYSEVSQSIKPYLKPGIRTVSADSPYLHDSETKFFDVSAMPDNDLRKVVTIFKNKYVTTRGKQARASKSVDEYISLLKKEANFGVPEGSVLLSRDCRRKGRAYLALNTTFASTNVWVFPISNPVIGRFYHSWFCSIFYQLNCELVGKNHAGTRKMDASEFDNTLVPDFSLFSNEEIDDICNCPVSEFVTLNSPSIRDCDKVWAKIISPDNWEEILNEASRYLGLIATERES